jgi:ABC-2 type transport system permease protein
MVAASRTFRFAVWLGWQAESNWTDPFLFAVYSIVRPVATVFITTFMYIFIIGIGAGASTTVRYFSLMYIGTVFYLYAQEVMFGLSWIVMEDREHYKVLKYWYITPSNIYVYLLGRGFAKVIITTIAVCITLIVGVCFLGVRVSPSGIDLPLLIIANTLGFIGMLGMGIILAGVSLVVARHNQFIGESLAGVFYLLSGVIFPIAILPQWIIPVSKAIPFTYWLELTKRAILGFGDPTFAGMENLHLIAILSICSLVLIAISIGIFKLCDRIARQKGYLDRTTWY